MHENASPRVVNEILRDNCVFGVSEVALHGGFGSLLHGSLDGIIAGRRLQAHGQVNNLC